MTYENLDLFDDPFPIGGISTSTNQGRMRLVNLVALKQQS